MSVVANSEHHRWLTAVASLYDFMIEVWKVVLDMALVSTY